MSTLRNVRLKTLLKKEKEGGLTAWEEVRKNKLEMKSAQKKAAKLLKEKEKSQINALLFKKLRVG